MPHTHQINIPDVSVEPGTSQHTNKSAYFVGSGIAALAGLVEALRLIHQLLLTPHHFAELVELLIHRRALAFDAQHLSTKEG